MSLAQLKPVVVVVVVVLSHVSRHGDKVTPAQTVGQRGFWLSD